MKLVYFDLETTTFKGNETELRGIGAIFKSVGKFNPFYKTMILRRRINKRLLWKHGVHLANIYADDETEILQSFMDFIEPDGNEDVVLVAHNNDTYDAPILIRSLVKNNVLFSPNIYFYDSMKLMANLRDCAGYPKNLSVESCLQALFNETYRRTHDGFEDANFCRRISEEAVKRLPQMNASMKQYLIENGPQQPIYDYANRFLNEEEKMKFEYLFQRSQDYYIYNGYESSNDDTD